jgi:hypothetical protein
MKRADQRTGDATSGTALLLLTLVCLTSGCCTPAVWKQTAAKHWQPLHQPPEVWLTQDRQNALVVFTQNESATGKTRSAACWISSWPELAAAGDRELRQLTNSIAPLTRLNVVTLSEPESLSPTDPEPHAVWTTEPDSLTIYLGDQVFGPKTPPATHQERKTTARILLTPVGIAGDAVIVATVITALGLSGGAGASY